ncbi:MAG: monofunctional biosynthetic peptidoglycan transglycosylase, partial [Myxococcota bacterium]
GLVFVLPIGQALLLNVVGPPVTLTMLSRSWSHLRAEGELRLPSRDWVPLSEIPDHVAAAALASEDARFFEHRGFDWRSIESALAAHRDGEQGAGGSSISQQTAKNVFLWQHRSWLRKGLEIWYTFWMEVLVPKHRILEVYLNIAETGPMTFGVEAGARRWFGSGVEGLTPLQSAQLISLLPDPRDWTPEDRHVRARAERLTSWASPLPEDWRER